MSKKGSCSICGLPKPLSKRLFWDNRGRIFTMLGPRSQVFFMDTRELELIVSHAIATAGLILESRIREERRKFTRQRILSQTRGGGGSLARNRLFRKQAIRVILEEAALYGMGNLSIDEMVPGKEIKLNISHPYHPNLLAGDLLGLWEGFFEVKAQYSLEKIGTHEFFLHIESLDKSKYKTVVQREQKEENPGKRDKAIERCRKCKLPIALRELRWDAEHGTIYHPGENRYYTLMEKAGFANIHRAIKEHLSDDFKETISKAFLESLNGDFAAQKSEDEPYENLFGSFCMLGWGRVKEVKRRPFLEEITIAEAIFPSLIETKLSAFFQRIEGEPASSEIQKNQNNDITITIGPRLSEYSMHTGNLRNQFPALLNYPSSFLPF